MIRQSRPALPPPSVSPCSPAASRPSTPAERGQASVLLVGLVVIVVALSVAVVGVLRLRSERLQAQRIADAASLAAVAALLGGRPADEVRLAVERYVGRSARGATVTALVIEPVHEVVTVRVRLRPLGIGLPSLLGPRPVGLAATAVARAQPGEAAPATPTSAGGSASVDPRSGARPVPDGGRSAVFVSSLPDGTDLTVLPRGVPATYRPMLESAAREQRLPVALLAAQLAQESGFDPRSLSPMGAAGIAQFMPGTWAGSWNPWRARSPYEPVYAIRAQSLYMRDLLLSFRRDVTRSLAAYNAGAGRVVGAVSTWPLETQAYVERILEMVRSHDVSSGAAAGPPPLDPVPRLSG